MSSGHRLTIAIDPAVHAASVALFRDQTLLRAAFVPALPPSGGPRAVALTAWEWVAEAADPTPIGLLVVEKPQVYAAAHQKGDQADIVDLAIVVGALVATIPATEVRTPRPAEWKGQVPKPIHNRRTWDALSPAERETIEEVAPGLLHNVLDAIGLGLWAVRRTR